MTTLADVKVGEKVFCYGCWQNLLLVVEKVTPTQIVCASSRFSKKDGRQIGASAYRYARIRVATEADFAGMRLEAAQAAIRELKVTSENLEAVEALLK